MALFERHEEHEGEPHEGEPAKLGTAGPGGADAKKKQHRDNMILIVVALLGVIVTYLIYRKQQAAASGTTGTTSALPSTTGQVLGGGGGSPYADQMAGQLAEQQSANASAIQGLQTALGNLSTQIAGLGSGPGPGGANPLTAAPAPAATPGFGSIDIGGSSYDILGEAGTSNVYNVGGGAPVFFGNANSIAQGKAAEQQAVATHGYEYVPTDYASLIGSAPGAPAPGQPGFKAA